MRETIRTFSKEFRITRDETELAIATLLECPRFKLYFDEPLSSNTKMFLYIRLHQLTKGVPIEYLTKRVQFLNLTLDIAPNVFIPRLETEYLIELIAKNLPFKPSRILDIGTGCGAISLALAQLFPKAQIYATDISQDALNNARGNIKKLHLEHRIFPLRADLFSSISARFDLIVSNPPYIPLERLKSLAPSVKDFEPLSSLIGGWGGIQFIKRIILQGVNYLTPKGTIVIEIDEDEVEDIQKILTTKIKKFFVFKEDQFGRFRYLVIGNFRR